MTGTTAGPLLRTALRVGGVVHALRSAAARASGFAPGVVAYTSYGSTGSVRILARVLIANPGHAAGHEENARPANIRGWRAFTSVPVPGAAVTIEIDGSRHEATADGGGLVDRVIPVRLEPGWHTAILHAEGTGPVEARVFVIAPGTSLGIVSDIDDTVMVTALPRPFLAFWNTFVLNERARSATPGMAVLMDRILRSHPDAPVIYLSTGPWNAAPTLARFLARNLYPAGALLLTDWGLTQERWFRSGKEHKARNLERLARDFPDVRWLLVGDDGQHDEEVYGAFAKAHPGNVAAVAIRQLSPGEAVLAGGRAHTGGAAGPEAASSAPWVYAGDGAGLQSQLAPLGLG